MPAFTTVFAGDLNSDGHVEILAGAPTASHEMRNNAGTVYLFFAP